MNIGRMRPRLGLDETVSGVVFDNSPREIAAELCQHLVDVGCSQMIRGIDPQRCSSAREAIVHLSEVQDFIAGVLTNMNREHPGEATIEARDKWLYEQCCNCVPYKEILRLMEVQMPPEWELLTSVSGIRKAAITYATRHNLPPIPIRQKTRRPRAE